MNGRPFTIIGVMPDGFVWVGTRKRGRSSRSTHPHVADLSLREASPGSSPGSRSNQAAAEMQSIAQEVERENPKDYARLRFPVVPLRELVVGNIRPLLWVLSGAVFFVFLIAVSNVANLMLARATARQREIAIRLSIGAGRGQLVRQLMTESLMLSSGRRRVGLALGVLGSVGAALAGTSRPAAPQRDRGRRRCALVHLGGVARERRSSSDWGRPFRLPAARHSVNDSRKVAAEASPARIAVLVAPSSSLRWAFRSFFSSAPDSSSAAFTCSGGSILASTRLRIAC